MGNVCGAKEIITVLPCGLSKDEISASLGPQSHPPHLQHADLTVRGAVIPYFGSVSAT
jgi:hypothetical protein